MYLPYWTFDSLTHTRYSAASGGEHYYVTVGSREKQAAGSAEDPVVPGERSGEFERFFDDTLVVASRRGEP